MIFISPTALLSRIMAQYIDLKFESTMKHITSAKRSVLYDISKKCTAHSFVESDEKEPTDDADDSWKAKLSALFPIENLTIFNTFDNDLKTKIEQRNAVVSMYLFLN